jgi:GNAT superfamily N-acetyltransferase
VGSAWRRAELAWSSLASQASWPSSAERQQTASAAGSPVARSDSAANWQTPYMRTIDATIGIVTMEDFDELLPLVRAYCDFYEATPSDRDLLDLFGALVKDPAHEGLQLLARSQAHEPVGFATLYWTWSTTRAGRLGVMEDLFVAPSARGNGLAEALIDACADRCRRQGAELLAWQTAPTNLRAQRVYDRVGATREQWIDYSLPVSDSASS